MTVTPVVRKIAGALALACLLIGGMSAVPALAQAGQDAIVLHRLDRLHDKLALTSSQQPLWDHAEELTKESIQHRFDQSHRNHDALLAALDNPQVNLRKLAAEQDHRMEEAMAAHRKVRDAWLDLYDSLNPTQKATVLKVLKMRLAHAQHRRHCHHHRGHGDHNWQQHGDKNGAQQDQSDSK